MTAAQEEREHCLRVGFTNGRSVEAGTITTNTVTEKREV
jgi:hypothetical protein